MQEILTLSRKEHEKDSMVFGAIWAGAKVRKKKLRTNLSGTETTRGMCAIGAGNRGLKVTRPPDVYRTEYNNYKGPSEILHQLIPMVRFATANGVSEDYACGVNDGFENNKGTSKQFYQEVDMNSRDYARGFDVGLAVRQESGYPC